MQTDFRTKSDSEWTYYVIDHLPTMNQLYRFDTVEEAIEKYNELPDSYISALGSSIHSIHEIDHIHRRNGLNILVTDCERMDCSLWRDSQEIQDSINQLISSLGVKYELSSSIFGNKYPSVAIPLEHHMEQNLDHYFHDKILYPSLPNRPLSALNEVYVVGQGWRKSEDFLTELDSCRSKNDGADTKTYIVTQLNMSYINQKGETGQADLDPLNFRLIKDKSDRDFPVIHSKSSDSLTDLIQAAEKRMNHQQVIAESDVSSKSLSRKEFSN